LEKLTGAKFRKESKLIDCLAFVYQRSLETFHRVLPKRRKFIDMRCFIWFVKDVVVQTFSVSEEEYDLVKSKMGLPAQKATVYKNSSLWEELEPYLDFRISKSAINISCI
jgi:hypothetical protein